MPMLAEAASIKKIISSYFTGSMVGATAAIATG
jgi:hypothetical protein